MVHLALAFHSLLNHSAFIISCVPTLQDPEEYWGKQENRLKKNREAMQAAGMDDDDPDFDLLADLLVEKMRIDVQVAQE